MSVRRSRNYGAYSGKKGQQNTPSSFSTRRSSARSFGMSERDSFSVHKDAQSQGSEDSSYTLRSSARINEIRQRTREDAVKKAELSNQSDAGVSASMKRPAARPIAQRNTVLRKRVAQPKSAIYSRKGSHTANGQGFGENSAAAATSSASSERKRPSVVKNRRAVSNPSIAEKNFSEHLWTKNTKRSSKSSDGGQRRSSVTSASTKRAKTNGNQGIAARTPVQEGAGTGGSFGGNCGRSGSKGTKRSGSKVRAVLIALVAVFALCGIGFGIDNAVNGDKIYSGISIGEVQVAGLTREEAVEQVSSYYSQRVAENIPTFYSSEEAQQNPESFESFENIEEQISYEESLENRTQWTIPAAKLDATFNVDAIVDRAFEIGRSDGGIFGRLQAGFQGRNLQPECSFNETTLNETLDEMTNAIGNKRVNYGIEMNDEGIASVTGGHDGNEVVRDWLVSHLNETYLGTNSATSFVLETQYMPLQITEEKAQACADSVNASISAGAQFVYEDQTWDASRTDLASWITTDLEQQGDDWILKPCFDESVAKKALFSSLKSNIDQSNLQVVFEKNDQGEITVSSNATGTVPLVADAVTGMNDSFFVTESRTEAPQITLSSTDLPSTLSFEDAQDFGVITEISSFTTQYSSGAEARTHNIHTAADLLNNSIIKANNGSWSFNDTAGEATEDKGYQNAGAIVGGEYSDAVGGGICQVATTVFNAIYDAGYPIKERHNHTLHIESYPEGRDAAIAYPYMDLVWENDTGSDVLLAMTYTNSSVTATLWGVDPGYEVSTEYGEWQEGEAYSVVYKNDDTVASGTEYTETTGVNGSSISITRTVKSSDGSTVLHEDVFSSTYRPKDEVIVRGTA